MEHSYFRDKISAYKDSGLNTEEQYLIELHLQECAECRALLEKLETFDNMVAEESGLSSDEYFEKLAGKIDEKLFDDPVEVTEITTRSRWAGLSWKMAATAASVAFLVFIGFHKDDILPPSQSKSPVFMAPSLSEKADSMGARGQDSSARSLQTSPAVNRPPVTSFESLSAGESNYLESESGANELFSGDVEGFVAEQDQTLKRNPEFQFNSSRLEETLEREKPSSLKEKIVIRGGRTNEVEYEVNAIDQEEDYEATLGFEKEADRKNERPRETSKLIAPEPPAVDEEESNYKRVRKTSLAKEKIADKKSFDDEIDGPKITEDEQRIIIIQDAGFSSGLINGPEYMRSGWRTTRDSLLLAWPQFGSRRVNKSAARDRLDYDAQLSQADRDNAFEVQLFDLLRNIIRVSDDSLETDRAVEIISEMAKWAGEATRKKAKLYLDSLEATPPKSD